jgi:hypothetical protein
VRKNAEHIIAPYCGFQKIAQNSNIFPYIILFLGQGLSQMISAQSVIYTGKAFSMKMPAMATVAALALDTLDKESSLKGAAQYC